MTHTTRSLHVVVEPSLASLNRREEAKGAHHASSSFPAPPNLLNASTESTTKYRACRVAAVFAPLAEPDDADARAWLTWTTSSAM